MIKRRGEGNQIALTVDDALIEGNILPPPSEGRIGVAVDGILVGAVAAAPGKPTVMKQEAQLVPGE